MLTEAAAGAARAMGLPDPRRYGPGAAGEPLLELAAAGDTQREALRRAIEKRLADGADGHIRRALAAAPTRETHRRLWNALCDAAEKPQVPAESVVVRVFAMPWLMVCGARAAAVIPGVIPQVGELARLLEAHGAFGSSRNLGLSAVLCSTEALEALAPSEIYRASRSAAPPAVLREIAAAPIALRAGEEAVHLRFLVGAAIAPAHAPSVVETAARIGAWGMPLARAMAAQLKVAGVQLLPLPRAPAGVLGAGQAGRRAQLEAAFDLFMGNAVRRFRLAAGDPALVISSHASDAHGPEVRVSLSSLLDDTLLEGFRWPLHPLDDLERIVGHVREMARECRITDLRVAGAVLPDRTGAGGVFLRAEPRT